MSGDYSFLKRRAPPTPLDRDNLNATLETEKDDPVDIASKEEIENRKILRIRRPGATAEEATIPVQKTDFKLFSNGTADQPNTSAVSTAQPVSFFSNKADAHTGGSFFAQKPKSPEKNSDQNKEGAANSDVAGGLFFNNSSAADLKPVPQDNIVKTDVKATDAKTLFANNSAEQKKSPEKPKAEAKPAEETKKTEDQPKSFFSGVAAPASNNFFAGSSTTGGSSLFGENKGNDFFKKDEAEKAEPKKAGLFDNLLGKAQEDKPAGFFGQAAGSTKSGLFDGLLNSVASNNTGCGSNLFNNSSTPLSGMFAKASGNDDEDEEAVNEDEEEVPGQEDVTDPTKSTGNYKYEQVSTELISLPVINFKVNTVPGMGAGTMSLEKIKDKAVSIVFRNGAKVILHNSYVLPKLSKVGPMNGRTDAMWIETASYNDEGKISKNVCKMQFHDEKAANDFKKTAEEAINA